MYFVRIVIYFWDQQQIILFQTLQYLLKLHSLTIWNMYPHELTAFFEPITCALSGLTSVNGNLTSFYVDGHLYQRYQSVLMKAILKCFCVVNCNITVIGEIIEKIKVWLTVGYTITSPAVIIQSYYQLINIVVSE